MKKICSGMLLSFLLLFQMQVMQVYAQDKAELESQKNTGAKTLDAVGLVIDKAVVQLDDKIKNKQKSQKLEDKHQEIGEYLERVQKEISEENSSEDIQELVEEAKKVVVLKVVSGVTEYQDVEKNIDSEVAHTSQERKEAMESIQDSLETENGDYSIIVRTKYSKKKLEELLERFDNNTTLELMYETDGKKYFEVFLKEDSIFRQEMLEDIESGILPESFVGMEIVLPEVYSIEMSSETIALLDGEDLGLTWGIEKYESYKYFPEVLENSKNIRVGVVDTGIDYNHPDLKNNVNQGLGKDFVNDDDDAWDDQGHGTHVAGTIAANINGSGIIGVNPHVDLVPLKICTSKGFCPSYAVLRALDYAKQNEIDILNMSLGGRGDPSNHAICGAIESVTNAGTIVVAASGNSNIDASNFIPGGCNRAITVAAIDSDGKRAVFSNYGSKVDVAAPGVNVYSTYPINKGSYKKLSGTSMATPHIVGLISLIQGYKSDVTSSEIKTLFQTYQSEVQIDGLKTIAAGVDASALFRYLKNPIVIEEEVIVEDEILIEEEVEEQIEEEETEDFYEVLLDEITYVDREIKFIENQEVQDEAVMLANLELESEANIEISNIDISPASVNLNIFGDNNSIEINPSFSGLVETGMIDMGIVDIIDSGNTSSQSQVFSETGESLSDTEINNIDENVQTVSGLLVPVDFDVYNLPESTSLPDFSGIEINNFDEEPEIQEIFIDGAKKGVKINSIGNEQGKELIFSTGSLNEDEQIFLDEEGNRIEELGDEINLDEDVIGDTPAVIIKDEILLKSENNNIKDEEFINFTPEVLDGENKGNLNLNNIGIQNIYICTIYKEELCKYQIPKSSNYTVFQSELGVGQTSASRSTFVITGKKIGTSVFEIYIAGNLEYTIYLEVEERNFTEKIIEIYPGFTKTIIGDCRYAIREYDEVSFGRFYKNGKGCYFQAYSPGNTEVSLIYEHRNPALENFRYTIKVLPIPTPQKYTVEFSGGSGRASVYLPEEISNFNVSREGDNIYDNLIAYDTYFYIDVEHVGESQIILKDKTFGFTRYIINVISEPSYQEYVLNETDYLRVWDNDNYDFKIQDTSIVDYRLHDDDGYIQGLKVGETEIHISHYEYGLRKVWKIKVLPQPEPIEIYCEVEVGKQCELMVKNGGYYYETDISYGDYEIDSWRDRFRFESERSGEYTAYIKSFYGNYITHIFKIKVIPEAADVEICDMAVGGFCDLGWIKTNNRSLTFHQTNPGLVHVQYTRETHDPTETERENYEKGAYDHDYENINQGFRYKIHYELETLKVGKGEVYIFDEREHLYTIKINSFIVDPIELEEWSLKVNQGERISTKILNGGGKYREYGVYDSSGNEIEIDYFDTDSDKHEDGFYLPTGDVTLSDTQEGRYYPVIADRYNQIKEISLSVLDADLRLSTYIPNDLKVGDWYNIQVLDRYQKVVEIREKKGQGIVSFRYVKDTRNNEEYIRIKGLKSGNTTLEIEDAEGNTETIFIKIGKGFDDCPDGDYTDSDTDGECGEAPEDTSGKIRYIRDYLNGSSKSTTNAWVEIQALEQGSNINKAQGIIPTTDITSPSGTLSSLTDDSYSDWTGKSGAGEENYLQLDLGGLYDIETIRVWHYYKDRRIFNDNKTQVSFDGVNWITIYDSSVDGKYAESSSGKTHTVPNDLDGGDNNQGDDTSGKIRYIRDWLNGSSRSTSNAWSEIKVLEKGTGINKAKGIIPSTDIVSPTGNLSYLTDEEIIADFSSWTGKSKAGELNYMQLDLGEPYNIEEINIIHFFTDGRIFYDTKTEVSADGVTWYTLFDSTTEGTYAEPKNGSGRSYEVNIGEDVDSSIIDEFDELLEALFEELGVQSIQSDGVEINDTFTLSQASKDKVDEAIQRWISEKGKESVLVLKNAIPELKQKEKYDSYEFGVILDYISDSIEKALDVTVIHNIIDTSDGNIGGLKFEVSNNLQGKISNIGVQYIDGNGSIQKQELKIQSDGEYIVAFSGESCSRCSDLKPYYLISGRTDIVIASVGNNIKIANSPYNQFVNILKSIWSWKGYTKQDSIKALVDIKEDYDDYASLAVSLFPGVGEIYDISTLVLGIDPFTGEDLSPLMKTLTLAGLLGGVTSGKAARDAGNLAITKIGDELGMTTSEIAEVGTEVASEYKVSSIDDVIQLKDKLKLDYFKQLFKSKSIVAKNTSFTTGGDILTEIKDLGFISRIHFVADESIVIKEVFKGSADGFTMSDIILDQIKFAGKDPNKLTNILLDDVIDQQILKDIVDNGNDFIVSNWGSISGLDGMTRNILEKTGKNIKEIKIYKKSSSISDEYDIQLILN